MLWWYNVCQKWTSWVKYVSVEFFIGKNRKEKHHLLVWNAQQGRSETLKHMSGIILIIGIYAWVALGSLFVKTSLNWNVYSSIPNIRLAGWTPSHVGCHDWGSPNGCRYDT